MPRATPPLRSDTRILTCILYPATHRTPSLSIVFPLSVTSCPSSVTETYANAGPGGGKQIEFRSAKEPRKRLAYKQRRRDDPTSMEVKEEEIPPFQPAFRVKSGKDGAFNKQPPHMPDPVAAAVYKGPDERVRWAAVSAGRSKAQPSVAVHKVNIQKMVRARSQARRR